MTATLFHPFSSELDAALSRVSERFCHRPLSFSERRDYVNRTRDWCAENGVFLVGPSSDAFERLREISDPPPLLFVRGEVSLLAAAAIAVVGTRRPSEYGLGASMAFSRRLARLGFTIVSGLARGIDGAAHRAAIEASGRTVAVLGHGLDRCYPSNHRALAREIVERGGCLVSEYPPGTPPLPHHFPQRNRIISGLSLGTLVIEAAERSGSLITARFALEQNREVFVLPGRYDDGGFSGSHILIQEGGKLVTTAEHLLSEFSLSGLKWPQPENKGDDYALLDPDLQCLFENGEGTITLQQLFEAERDKKDRLLAAIERGKELGIIVEISPQRFRWLGHEVPTGQKFGPV